MCAEKENGTPVCCHRGPALDRRLSGEAGPYARTRRYLTGTVKIYCPVVPISGYARVVVDLLSPHESPYDYVACVVDDRCVQCGIDRVQRQR